MSSFSGFNTTPSSNPLNVAQRAPVNMVFVNRAPTVEDNNYEIGTEWENTVTFVFYKLLRITWNTMTKHADAIWSIITPGSGSATNLTDQVGAQVVPDGSSNINVIGDGTVMTSTKTGASQLTLAITGIVPVIHGGTGVNTITNHAIMIGQGTSPITTVGPLTNGQLAIGSTGSNPVAANLTSTGGSITITNGAGTINLETAGGSGAITQVGVDASTPPGTNPVVPTGAGLITVTGAQAAAGTIANAIRTNSLAANTYTVQIQRASAVVASDATKNGIAHFKNTDFAVDANGFVSLTGGSGGAVTTFTDDFAGSATPVAGVILVHSGNNLTVTAGGNALNFNVTGTTNHAVQVGNASGSLTSIGTGTSGQALVSGGAGSNPAFGVLPIVGGGTNASSFSTTNGVVKFDGTSLVTSTTSKIDASNRATNTAQPCFFASLSTTVPNATGDGSPYTIIFDSVSFDQNSNYNAGTGIFTAPVAGKYHFEASVFFNNVNANMSSFQIDIAATSLTLRRSLGYAVAGASSSGTGENVSGIISMAASDTAYVFVAVGGSTKTAGILGASGVIDTWFSGHLIC
jgi:hypothetical protein